MADEHICIASITGQTTASLALPGAWQAVVDVGPVARAWFNASGLQGRYGNPQLRGQGAGSFQIKVGGRGRPAGTGIGLSGLAVSV